MFSRTKIKTAIPTSYVALKIKKMETANSLNWRDQFYKPFKNNCLIKRIKQNL